MKVKITESDINKMVREAVLHILKESTSQMVPSVYVGTYGKYNSGSLKGKWVDLTDFDSKEEFIDYCYNTLHADEPDAELMFQDYEYIPNIFISESYIDERFWDFLNNNNEYSYDVKCAVADYVSDVDEYFDTIDNIVLFRGCDSMDDVAYSYIQQGVMPAHPEYYFDYEQYGTDCSYDGPSDDESESIYAEYGVDEGDDRELGYAIVDSYGGVENLDKETIMRYIDFHKLGQAIESDGNWTSCDEGIIEIE